MTTTHILSPVELIDRAIKLGATNSPGWSRHHGEDHWKAVAITGMRLADEHVNADRDFILTFAALHDICRLDDGSDPYHGQRAAILYRRMFGRDADPDMMFALGHHVGTLNARDYPNANVGLCWDADRLNMWRVGERPLPKYLTTRVARQSWAARFSRALCDYTHRMPDWSTI